MRERSFNKGGRHRPEAVAGSISFFDQVLQRPDGSSDQAALQPGRHRRQTARRGGAAVTYAMAIGLTFVGSEMTKPEEGHIAAPHQVSVAEQALETGAFQKVTEGTQTLPEILEPIALPEGHEAHEVTAVPQINPDIVAREAALEETGTADYGLNIVTLPEGVDLDRPGITGGVQFLTPPGKVFVAPPDDGSLTVTRSVEDDGENRLTFSGEINQGEEIVVVVLPPQ